MSRDKIQDAPTAEHQIIEYDPDAEVRANRALTQTLDRAMTVAAQVGYDGPLTADALDDAVHVYQRRTVEDCLQLGRLLLIRKELTPHAEWVGTVERLGFHVRTAQRFMSAALKTSKSDKLSHLAATSRSAGHYLELLTLDDEDVSALADGGTVAGLTLDDVDRMPVSELRRRLRAARSESEAKDKILADKGRRIDELQTKIEQARKTPREIEAERALDPDAELAALEDRIHRERAVIELRISTALANLVDDMRTRAAALGLNRDEVAAGVFAQVARTLGEVREAIGVKAAPDGELMHPAMRAALDDLGWDADDADGNA